MMDDLLTWTFPNGSVEPFRCSHCKAAWHKRWVHCPHCQPEKYADFERRREAANDE